MKYGLDVATTGENADPRTLADLAAEAEDAGWDGFFIWDVLFAHQDKSVPVIDPWIALAAIAARTRRIKIGAMLTPLSRRRPWQVARATVALDLLSNGRLIFGAGLGYQDLDFTTVGEEYDPVLRAAQLDESLDILTGLWTGAPFSYHGQHYQVEEAVFLPRPLQQPRIPIWLAGGWPHRKPLRRAARWDGLYLMTVNQVTNELLTPAEIREIVTYINSHRASTEPFEIGLNGETPPDPAAGSAIVRPYIEAGATWWIEIPWTNYPFDVGRYRQRVHSGPPRV